MPATGTALSSVALYVPLFGGKPMTDDLSKKRPQDSSRVNTHEEYEVRYWSEKFGVSPEKLKAAVEKVGNSAEAVEKELRR
jgi:hypothetical protein